MEDMKDFFEWMNVMKKMVDNYETHWVFSEGQFDIMSEVLDFAREVVAEKFEQEVK